MTNTLGPAILQLLLLATLVWAMIGVIRKQVTNRRTGQIALGAGVVLAFVFQVDIPGALGLTPALPWPGLNQVLLVILNPLLGGVIVGGGPSYVIDFIRKIQGTPAAVAAIQRGGITQGDHADPAKPPAT